MSDRRTSSQPSPLWGLLYVAPWFLFGVFLVPGLGEYGEGLWPEWFAPELVGTELFGDFAIQVRQWSIGVLVLATVIAVAVYVWTVRGWSARLKTFDVARVTGYRGFVWSRVPVAFGGACAAALFAVLVSESLREADVPGWVIFVAAAGVFGWLQFFAIIFARQQTRQLYRGR